MCFYTSWKLSVLAFTAIGPHLSHQHVRQVGPSQGIFRDILAAIAEAHSSAVQALSSIRTVRAFSTEPLEVGKRKYSRAMGQALQKGTKGRQSGLSSD